MKQNYSWKVKMYRYSKWGVNTDTTEYEAVIAITLDNAVHKAVKQACKDSGFTDGWVVVSAERGNWVVA